MKGEAVLTFPLSDHPVEQVRLAKGLILGPPTDERLLSRPAAPIPGSGWKRPEAEYQRPRQALELVGFAEARKTDPETQGDLDARRTFWTKVRGVEYHRKQLSNVETRRWAWFELVPELHNPHDSDAVALDLDGVRIGYVAASMAYRLHWRISYLNGDGRACYVPGVILNGAEVWVVLPTEKNLDGHVDRGLMTAELNRLWDALPQSDRDAVAVNKFRETPQTVKQLIKLRHLAPHLGLPRVGKPELMPRAWREFMREQKFADAEVRAQRRNTQVFDLLDQQLSRAAIARRLGISTTTVSKVLKGDRPLVTNGAAADPARTPSSQPLRPAAVDGSMSGSKTHVGNQGTATSRKGGTERMSESADGSTPSSGQSSTAHAPGTANPAPSDEQTKEVQNALAAWRKGLLTVSGASRLVNYHPTKSRAVSIEAPTPDEILQRLNSGQQWAFAGRLDKDLDGQGVAGGLGDDVSGDEMMPVGGGPFLKSDSPIKELGPVLRTIMRTANTEWLDRGLHTLYLAVGMLNWRDIDGSKFASPLILVPVDLVPLGPRDVPRLAGVEDEPLLNPALRVPMERLGVELPQQDQLDGQLLEAQLAIVAESVANRQDWHVTGDMVLSLFSFHKEAMYRDLVENADTILQHPIVRLLGTSDPLKQSRQFDFDPIQPKDIDRLAPPESTPLVLDADSSQRAAIAAAVAGHSFVMDGPPGTGKSQTIANMIGALLHAGKTVLFVSEKAAALEVVRNRLEHVGLLPYLFELHSSRAGRKEVATELLRSLETRPILPRGMSDLDVVRAAQRREQLSRYAAAMNETRIPLNRSLHDVIGRVAELCEAPHVPVASVGHRLTEHDYQRFTDAMGMLGISWRPAEQGSSFLWKDVVEPGPLEDCLVEGSRSTEELREAMEANADMARCFDLQTPWDAEQLARLTELQTVSRPDGALDAWLTKADWSDLEAGFKRLESALSACREADAVWVRASGVEWETVRECADQLTAPLPARRTPRSSASRAADSMVAAGELRRYADSLESGIAAADRLAESLGLPHVATAQDVERILLLAQLCSAPNKPASGWFDDSRPADRRRVIDGLQAALTTLDQREAEARPYFTDAALRSPVAGLLDRFRNQHRGLKKLSSSYRADKRLVGGMLASDVTVAEGIKGLERAVAWADAHFTFEVAAEAGGHSLGSYWQGRATDFDSAKDAVAVVDRVRDALAGLPMNDRLLGQLTMVSRVSLLPVVDEVTVAIDMWRAAFGTGGVLEPHQTLILHPLADSVRMLRERCQDTVQDADWLGRIDAALGRTHTIGDAERIVDVYRRNREARAIVVDDSRHWSDDFGSLCRGMDTDLSSLRSALDWALQVREVTGHALSSEQASALNSARPNPRLVPAKERWGSAVESLVSAFGDDRAAELRAELVDFPRADELFSDFQADPAGQAEWFRYIGVRAVLRHLGLDEAFVSSLDQRLPREQVPDALEKSLLRSWVNHITKSDARLTPSTADEREALRLDYRALDTELVTSAHIRIIRAVNSRRPQYLGMGEQGVIQREGMKKRRHIPVRELIGKAKGTVLALKPCFMMSPLAVSQFLPTDIRFDVVVFDEASQVTPSDAINCVYRGHSLILAGDDKQLPPTSFFEKMDEGELDSEDTDVRDFESILELAKASGGVRDLALKWHYRSADDALINFSNYKFYEGKLVVFPGTGNKQDRPAVTFQKVEGVYRRGATTDNPIEAAAVAERVIDHFTTTPQQTLGVVTFSVNQANAVLDAIDRARVGRRDLDRFFDVSERLDAFFVKSLESVQGDERDKIIFSIGYGPDENGKITTNFGVLNREKGWRRLNVAITRARQKVEVVSSVRAGDIPPSPNENVEFLRAYLDYSERGMPALAVNLGRSGAGPESPFEESVMAVLSNWGYELEPQVGSAGYRIDIGVRHPDHPGLFMLGVECDGYQYHSAPAARDRDRLREQVLRRLGWPLHRIWGTAWYRDRAAEEERLQRALEAACSGDTKLDPEPRRRAAAIGLEEVDMLDAPPWTIQYQEASVPRLPHGIDVSQPGAGFDMVSAVAAVVAAEGPAHIEVLYQRLREAWDIGRVGVKIRDNIELAIKHSGVTRDGDFLLVAGHRVPTVRTPSERTIRKVEQIHRSELAEAMALLLEEMGSATPDELTVATARLFGWGRTGSGIQGQLERAIDLLVASQRIGREGGTLVGRPR